MPPRPTRIASAAVAAARAAAIVAYSPTTSIEPFTCARRRARSAAVPTSRIRINASIRLLWPLSKGDRELDARLPAHQGDRRAAARCAEQTSEQLLRRADRLPVEREQQISDEHAGLCRRPTSGDADDEQRMLGTVGAALRLGEFDALSGEPEIAALEPSVQYRVGRVPGDRCRNHDAEAADCRGRRDTEQRAGGIEKRAASESVVHRRRGANHLIDGASTARWQWTADHRYQPRAGRHDVAPRARDGERELTDARLGSGPADRREAEPRH